MFSPKVMYSQSPRTCIFIHRIAINNSHEVKSRKHQMQVSRSTIDPKLKGMQAASGCSWKKIVSLSGGLAGGMGNCRWAQCQLR